MKFSPGAPDDGVNVSDTHPLKELATLAAGISAVLAVLIVTAVVVIDFAVRFIPRELEMRVFSGIDFDLTNVVGSSQDDKRLQALVDRLASHWDDNPYELRAAVLDRPDLNAMSLPGGKILVTSGLIEAASSENELAFVIGHELGHFKNRDHLRRLGRTAIVGLLLSAISGSSADPPKLMEIVSCFTTTAFDRDHERQADRFGLHIVAAEYGHVAEATRLFERLESVGLLGEVKGYLSTHPGPDDRAAQLAAWAAEQQWPIEGELSEF